MSSQPPVNTPCNDLTEQELHAFIDGELDAAGAARVRASLATSPVLAQRLALLKADKAMIARAYGPLIEAALPASLVAALEQAPPRATDLRAVPHFRAGWRAALAMAAALVLAVVGWQMVPPLVGNATIEAALAARSGAAHADERIAASSLMSAAERNQLLSATLGQPVKAPNLEKAGFKLQTVSVYAGKAVQLAYVNEKGHSFTVYLRDSAGPDKFELTVRGAMRVCLWQNEDLTAVMLGEMSSSEMLRVASLTYADLNF